MPIPTMMRVTAGKVPTLYWNCGGSAPVNPLDTMSKPTPKSMKRRPTMTVARTTHMLPLRFAKAKSPQKDRDNPTRVETLDSPLKTEENPQTCQDAVVF